MFISHRFGSTEAVSRARFWMDQLGFEVVPTDEEHHDASRLSLNLDFSKTAAAMALIDSIEASDPTGWPGFLTQSNEMPTLSHSVQGETRSGTPGAPTRTPIHVHLHEEPSSDPHTRKVVEYMMSRWE